LSYWTNEIISAHGALTQCGANRYPVWDCNDTLYDSPRPAELAPGLAGLGCVQIAAFQFHTHRCNATLASTGRVNVPLHLIVCCIEDASGGHVCPITHFSNIWVKFIACHITEISATSSCPALFAVSDSVWTPGCSCAACGCIITSSETVKFGIERRGRCSREVLSTA